MMTLSKKLTDTAEQTMQSGARSGWLGLKGGLAGLFGVTVATVGAGVPYTVNPTELANVRRLGDVLYQTPVAPGLHFKLPLIDTVDRLQVSLTTVHVPPFKVTTVDNQEVTLDISFNFLVPKNEVNRILYGVGRTGNTDVEDSILPVVMDRAGRVFAHQNMITVNQNREIIQAELEHQIFDAVRTQFGIDPRSLQIATHPSQAFMASNEAAIRTKNETIAAQNTENTKKAEANQRVITAKGEADSAIEAARGRAESATIEAEANKKRLEFEGQGQQSRLEAEIHAFGGPQLYVEYMKAQAALKWDGRQPQIVAGGGSATNLILPLPALAPVAP